jgi:hypothetical protein
MRVFEYMTVDITVTLLTVSTCSYSIGVPADTFACRLHAIACSTLYSLLTIWLRISMILKYETLRGSV